MTDDDVFEAQLRATLAAAAQDGAPERLVERVAAIPETNPMAPRRRWGWSLPAWRGAMAFAAAALVVILAGALILVPGGFLGLGGPPSVGPTASPSVPVPTPTPTASGTSVPTPTEPVPTATPEPTPVAMPADFTPLSATFVSPDEGWALGGTQCGNEQCATAVIAHTLDGGATWERVNAPPTAVRRGTPSAGLTSGVSGLRFADSQDGWAFGPELWATHDGGTTWLRVAVGGLPLLPVMALEAARGTVHAVVYDGASFVFRIASSPVGADRWELATTTLPLGAGPAAGIELVLWGSAGWVLENDRVVIAGARLVNGTWRTWQPPCLDVNGPAMLAAADGTHLRAACLEAEWGPYQGADQPSEHLWSSTDGGATFTRAAAEMPLAEVDGLAAPTATTVAAAGLGYNGTAVIFSSDGGRTWRTVLYLGQAQVYYVGFTTATQGFVISSAGMQITYDAGQTWRAVQF
jgi:hypothetical protein